MGVVYLAEQDEPVHRQVALKILRTGFDTAEIVARFRAEEQTLALMEHPNITRVYDAGITESGLPYFVMEYVVGESITDYSDTRRLTIRERILLVTQVCRAVQHAHQKGVIHRDIKPSNIIVTEAVGAPLCKVIDFGIAKAITPEPGSARLTMTGMALGTPAYMSPEQFISDGVDVDTRADIYALGAVLYELLAGVLPYDAEGRSGWAAVLAQHVTADAPSPSSRYASLVTDERDRIAADRHTDPRGLRKTLSGDLDCIALNALEREREHRYPTANALARDLEQHLENKPVSANTGSFQYRARKFTRRHRTAVTSGAVIAALLVATSVGATIQARRVSRARAIAVARQGQAEELIGFMLGDLRDKLTALGRLDLLDAVGDRALGYFAAVPASQLSNEELYRRAQALEQLGEVRMAQGKLPAAADLMRQSLGIASGLAAHDSLNGRWQIGLAHSHFWAGNVDWQLGNVDAALGHFVPFVTISRRLIAHYPDSLGYREELVYALNNIGFAKEAKGDLPGALASYRAAIGINQDLANRDPTRTDWQVSLANLQNAQAVVLRKIGDLPGALASHDRELALKSAVVAHDTTDRDRQLSLAVGHAYRGELHMLMGDMDGALTDARAAHVIYAALAAHDTSNSMYAYGLAKSDRQIAQVQLERGDAASALRGATDDEALTAHLLATSPENPLAASEAVLARTLESRALLAMGDARGAIQAAERAAAAGAAAVRKKPENIERHRAAADAYVALGDARSRVGDGSGARDAWTYGLALLDSTALKGAQTEVLAVQAATLLDLGRTSDAEPVVATLEQRGYRRPTFLRLVHERERPPA